MCQATIDTPARRQSLRPGRAAVLTTALTAGFIQTPHAADNALAVEEIVVTATRRNVTVADVPYNIQVISAETLREIGARDMSDFVRLVPGLNFSDGGARDGMLLVLRGLRTGFEGVGALTTTTYVDDTQVDRPTIGTPLDLRLVDIERIEVLRGPQGTLYGGGAIGGTIRYVTRKPDTEVFSGRIGSSLSSTRRGGQNYDVEGMVNVPLADGKAAVRAAAGYYDNEGFLDNPRLGGNNVNFDRTASARVAALWRPTEALTAEATYYFQRGKYGERDQVNSLFGDYLADAWSPAREQRDADLANLTLSYDFGGATLTSSTSWFEENAEGAQDVTSFVRDIAFAGLVADAGADPEALPPFTPVNVFQESSTTWTEELRLVSAAGGRFEWIAGAYWTERRLRTQFQERIGVPFEDQEDFEALLAEYYELDAFPIADDNEYFLRSRGNFKQQAVFGELTFNVTPQWQMSVGGRYFDYEADDTEYVIDQYGPFGRDEDGLARTEPFEDEFSFGNADDTGTIFRFNTSYQIGKGLTYLTIAEGYRPGGFNQAPSYAPLPEEARQFEPDSIVSYEVGAKSTFLEDRLYLSGAVFYIDWTDIQTTVPLGDTGFFVQGNAGKASSQGVELELAYRNLFVDGLTLSGGYSFTDVQLEETIPDLGFEGDRAPLVARHTGSYVLDYEWSIGNLGAGVNLSGAYTGSSATTFSSFFLDEDGERVPDPQHLLMESYWLHALSARLEGPNWTVRAFVENLFDEYATLSIGYFEYPDSPYASSSLERNINRPRTVGMSLEYRF